MGTKVTRQHTLWADEKGAFTIVEVHRFLDSLLSMYDVPYETELQITPTSIVVDEEVDG